jgi:hypothetical protein
MITRRIVDVYRRDPPRMVCYYLVQCTTGLSAGASGFIRYHLGNNNPLGCERHADHQQSY